ncbi:MAG: reductive dehalogenase domain-containing protein [Phototrophicaceae bacterium]
MIFSLFQKIMGNGTSDGNSGPSLDTMLQSMDKHLENFDELVLPLPESKPRTHFDSNIPMEERSTSQLTFKQMLQLLPDAIPLIRGMNRSAKMYDGKFKPKKSQASPKFIAQLEALAYAQGAKDIAYVKVPRNAIFQDKGIPHEYAVVFTVEMDKDNMETSPSFDSFHEVLNGYKNLATISNKLANFMQGEGFAAYPGTALGGLTDYPHLAELAGLGALGYHGLLITPGEGARLRINTIYTNIENLPIREENEHLWVRDFCAMCKKCVRKCPVGAIYEEPKARGDGGMQAIEHDSCRDYFAANHGCAVCLAVCPFSHTGYDKVQARFKGNPNAPQFYIPVYTP